MQNKSKKTKGIEEGMESRFFYKGRSMYPTLKQGEILYTRPVFRDLTPGDIIVYFDPDQHKNIVHRIIAIKDNLFVTRGDNNPNPDSKLIPLHNIIGKVNYIDSTGITKPVRGGKPGLILSHFQNLRNIIGNNLYILISPLYKWIKKTCIVSKLWHPKISRLIIKTGSGDLIKFIHRNRTVAVWNPSTGSFSCHPNYKLIIDAPSNQFLNEKTERNNY
jgi:signal peptidase I